MTLTPEAHLPDENQRITEQLLARVAEQDVHALSELYDRFSTTLRAIARRFLDDDADADDLLQEVFVKLWNQASSYSPSMGAPATWIITLTRNASLNRLRARTRRRAAYNRAALEPHDSPDGAPSSYDQAVSAETARLVRTALANLPEDQRTPLEMAYIGGLTCEEIARELRHPVGSVKSRLRRGMARMRLSLKSCDPDHHE